MTEGDLELGTRFIEGTITSNYQKIKSVNDKTCDSFSNFDSIIEDFSEGFSWIRRGLTHFFKTDEGTEVILPYAKFLKDKIDGEDIFDHHDPRSQRDIKRLLSLTCAMTYLFQLQRKKIKYKEHIFLVSELSDFININLQRICLSDQPKRLDALFQSCAHPILLRHPVVKRSLVVQEYQPVVHRLRLSASA